MSTKEVATNLVEQILLEWERKRLDLRARLKFVEEQIRDLKKARAEVEANEQ